MAEKVISVITPVYPPNSAHLAEAGTSLYSQKLPAGWRWEWLVQIDGDEGEVSLPADTRIKVARNRHAGPAVARTLALAKSVGSLIKSFDADDLLTEGALERDIRVLENNPEVGWTVSSATDLMPDGSLVSFPESDPPEGIMARGSIFDYWRTHDHRPPVVPGTMCIRRDLLVGLGGWMALPASEDTGLLIAANILSPGYFITETGLLYRKWPSQSTAQAAHADEAERQARFAVIESRAQALLAMQGE
ncbi:glycosyltransferase [Micromonospora eburnea]|uniref:Glycosyl transferase family 2 n=1 Tax=Micromonospora eburnea TaxID=227316 RepID=A0A1C6VF64_9ACTN|nr:glycosyltransferase [Micromonospora eburnea]SCL64968.1 Glycosyl transferase family 2 [Micromonospora eburnea]